jgi:hypothetical protein
MCICSLLPHQWFLLIFEQLVHVLKDFVHVVHEKSQQGAMQVRNNARLLRIFFPPIALRCHSHHCIIVIAGADRLRFPTRRRASSSWHPLRRSAGDFSTTQQYTSAKHQFQMQLFDVVQGAPAIWKLEDPAALQQVSPPYTFQPHFLRFASIFCDQVMTTINCVTLS